MDKKMPATSAAVALAQAQLPSQWRYVSAGLSGNSQFRVIIAKILSIVNPKTVDKYQERDKFVAFSQDTCIVFFTRANGPAYANTEKTG
jgi:hypothetical protein